MKERDRSDDLGIEGRIILNCISNKWNRRMCTGLIRLRRETRGEML
jgi:hypothetical protein